MIFFEDQTVEDLDNDEKTFTSNDCPVNLDLAHPPMVHDDDGGDVQIDNGDTIDDNTPIVDDVNPEELLEQLLPDPPTMSQLRRTTRECQSSRKYSLHEYV